MNEIVAKISSYNIFNNLVPGAILSFLLSEFGIYKLDASSIVVDVVVYYFLGMIMGRVGSIILDPILIKFGIVKKGEYNEFIDASIKDEKILTLLESGNMYRTIFAVIIFCLIAKNVKMASTLWLSEDLSQNLVLAVLAVLFLLSYRKQSYFISRRVDHQKDK